MSGLKPASASRSATVLLGVLAAALVVSIIAFPDRAFAASLQGLTVWWKYVFPALLPFLILSEMLMGFGVVHALGTLLEPLMRAMFRIPGVGGWALALGGTVGMPSGAKATAALRKQGLLSRGEAERLLAVSHLSSPVFIVTIVGVGFLGNARIGFLLTGIHIAAALAVGFTLRLVRGRAERAEEGPAPRHVQPAAHQTIQVPSPLSRRTLEAMLDAQMKDGRAFGKLLGDSVSTSLQSLMMIGGYMIIFSVIVQIIDITQLVAFVQQVVAFAVRSGEFGEAVRSSFSGLLEIHLGSYSFGRLSGLSGAPLVAAIAAVLGWGGFSSHAQAKSLVGEAKLRYLPFLAARCLHAFYSYALTFAVWPMIGGWAGGVSAAFARPYGVSSAAVPEHIYPQPLSMLTQLAALLAIMLAGSLLFGVLQKLKR